MQKMLCIVGGMNIGGAETFLMKVFRNMDRTQYSLDFAVAINDSGAYDAEIEKLGGKIYHITPKVISFIRNFNDIRRLVKSQKYTSVIRISQNSLSALELVAARFGGAKYLVFRSSNTSTCGGVFYNIIHCLFKWLPNFIANVKIAPSTEAAEFMFGKKAVKKNEVHILHNGLDVDIFRYHKSDRESVRKAYNLDDKLIVGHIGRFSDQKNHSFLLEVYSSIMHREPDSMLMLVGSGTLEENIRKDINKLCLNNNVIFTGMITNIPPLLSAMDIFIFPSLYEGMPNTVIEAQANGLPCIISDTITREADITGLVTYLPLEKPEEWAECALKHSRSEIRKDTSSDFIRNGYEMNSVVNEFVELCFK